ncbi:major facilitator superfamily domain-containing protein [Mariannaea sp. PMI_226]|nr:major facilitator superfamily domain-containing protein [Mariannaea sp. PMI_226]
MYLAYRHIKKQRARKAQEAASAATAAQNASDEPCAPGITELDENKTKSPEKKKKTPPTPEEKAEEKRRRVYRWKVIFGLFGPFALQALDTTIIASALPYIAEDFHQIKQLNWIISSFNLTSAAFLPFWAQMTDIFGRHLTAQASIVVVMVGSAICTGAPTSAFGVLLLGRSIQGIGVAGTNMCVRTILADRVTLSEYALNWTIFALVAGISFSIGPVIGGFLTQASWRWCFAINLPIAALSMPLIFVLLRKELLGPQPLPEFEGRDTSTRHGRLSARLSTVDYGGQLLFLWGLGLVILALTWSGGTYAWNSAHVLAPLVTGAVLSISWIAYEYAMTPGKIMSRVFPRQRAMIPWELLSERDIGLLFFINLGMGMAIFAVMYFMDLYFVLVEGKSSGSAGLALLYYLPGLGTGAYMAMFSSNVWPRQSLPALLLGAVTSAVGITGLTWAVHARRTSVVYGMMALTGHGIGIRMNPASLHALAYNPTMTAAISCLVSFALPFGGLVGLTIMSTVFNNKSGHDQSNPKDGIMWAFTAMIPFMWACTILTFFLGNVWISKDGSHLVVDKPYLWSILTRQSLNKERRVRGDALTNETATAKEQKESGDIETGLKSSSGDTPPPPQNQGPKDDSTELERQ